MLAFEARPPNEPGARSPKPYKWLKNNTKIPILAFNRMGYRITEYGLGYMEKTGIPFLQSMPESIRALQALAFHGARLGRRIPALPRPRGAAAATSGIGLERALKAAGLTPPRSRFAKSARQAAVAAQKLGFPVALKIVSAEISHKTEVGGVRLDLASAAAVRREAAALEKSVARAAPGAAISGFLVQEMVKGIEFILGVRDDPLYGPMMVVGAGGILVELVKDTAFRLLPVGPRDARAMLGELRIGKLLGGFRGAPPGDRDALVRAICGLSKFYLDHRPWLADLEINPLMVLARGDGVRAVDVRPIHRDT
jgi:acetyltransferase